MKPRRWFRFSLRTLLVLVALPACGLSWLNAQREWMRDRKILGARQTIEGEYYIMWWTTGGEAPWSLRILGEPGLRRVTIASRNKTTEAEKQHVVQIMQRRYPEAEIRVESYFHPLEAWRKSPNALSPRHP